MCRSPNSFVKAKNKEIDSFINALPSYDDDDLDIEAPMEYQRSSKKPSEIEDVIIEKIPTGIESFDSTTGGIIKGSCNCIGGDPGIGKSSLMLKIGNNLASQRKKVLYTGHEMPLWMTKQYCQRLGPWNEWSDRRWNFQYTDDVHEIINEISILKPMLVLVDSLQYIRNPQIDSKTGSDPQLKSCAKLLTEASKEFMCCIYLICHVTKDGNIAGPMSVEHAVDALWFLEKDEHYKATGRIDFYSHGKNRFGSARKTSTFCMTEEGLLESIK